MKVKNLVTAVAILTSTGSVLASDDIVFFEFASVSTKSRAEVIQELKQAQAAGLLVTGDSYEPPVDMHAKMKSRAEVASELAKARENGEPDFNDGEYPAIRMTHAAHALAGA